MIPIGIKPVGLNKRAIDILKQGQSVNEFYKNILM